VGFPSGLSAFGNAVDPIIQNRAFEEVAWVAAARPIAFMQRLLAGKQNRFSELEGKPVCPLVVPKESESAVTIVQNCAVIKPASILTSASDLAPKSALSFRDIGKQQD